MKCPYCSYEESKVIDSRPTDEGERIRRRRECLKCGKRFTTYERIDTIPMTVIKSNGTRETFDKNKLISGIMKSCNKRPITANQIKEIADDVENAVMSSMDKEIESKSIGNMVMDRLKDIDEVAYVRFASVYRQFKDINTFMDELNKIMDEKKNEKK